MTEIGLGKCPTCEDQMITVISFDRPEFRRTICPTCTVRELDVLRAKHGGTVILSREEIERCSE